MREWLDEWLITIAKIILAIIVVIIITNDVAMIVLSNWQSYVVTDEIAMAAGCCYYLTGSVEEAQNVAEDWAVQRGVNLTYFAIEEDTMTLTIETPEKNTYIIRHIKFLKGLTPTSKTISREIDSK
ncbi:hypothetical protein [Candidatus Oleimmundimicrobium sp.]|uniref:hypothetical protein n=1 Tax=Candidatus Oleimmundimicrobium sp. TaxID=3060597 RepID=UPI002726FAE5|nr:hypothetical protein [Candidatus Oleimmundimicrobium sp.]MDO8885633.1 hypothetical protein [Candidatus Oleimmundimicrobium sp.]